MLWELFQTSRIEQSNRNASDAKFSAGEAQADVGDLRRRIAMLEKQCDRITLAAMAMAEILRDKLKLTDMTSMRSSPRLTCETAAWMASFVPRWRAAQTAIDQTRPAVANASIVEPL